MGKMAIKNVGSKLATKFMKVGYHDIEYANSMVWPTGKKRDLPLLPPNWRLHFLNFTLPSTFWLSTILLSYFIGKVEGQTESELTRYILNLLLLLWLFSLTSKPQLGVKWLKVNVWKTILPWASFVMKQLTFWGG